MIHILTFSAIEWQSLGQLSFIYMLPNLKGALGTSAIALPSIKWLGVIGEACSGSATDDPNWSWIDNIRYFIDYHL